MKMLSKCYPNIIEILSKDFVTIVQILSTYIYRGGKSVATWQPSCQKVFEESGSGRKFLDPSPLLSHKQAIR